MLTLSPETEALVRARAAAAGKTPDEVIREAVSARPATPTSRRDRIALMEAISLRCAALPLLDSRSAEEIIGYDECGVPR